MGILQNFDYTTSDALAAIDNLRAYTDATDSDLRKALCKGDPIQGPEGYTIWTGGCDPLISEWTAFKLQVNSWIADNSDFWSRFGSTVGIVNQANAYVERTNEFRAKATARGAMLQSLPLKSATPDGGPSLFSEIKGLAIAAGLVYLAVELGPSLLKYARGKK